MKMNFTLAMCSAMIGALVLSSPALAQQKTAKACQQEWQANKAANQAAGITQKAYVEKCRAGARPHSQRPSRLLSPTASRSTKACGKAA